MDSERRSLYNSLRLSWLLNPDMPVEPWQVEDYRAIPLQALFDRLELQGIHLTRPLFIALSDPLESPEDLLENLVKDLEVDNKGKDQIYLLVFELWRRLVPEKLTLTIFCDELDYQIYSYDFGTLNNYEALQDTLEHLREILEENIELGVASEEAFELICSKCANNIEGFLYDFISERLDENNTLYARELFENFEGYIKNSNWFLFLKIRLLYSSDPDAANELLAKLLKNMNKQADVELDLDVLNFLGQKEDTAAFIAFLKQTLLHIEYEEDFKELLIICSDFCQQVQQEQTAKKIDSILKKRSSIDVQKTIHPTDPDLMEFGSLMNHAVF